MQHLLGQGVVAQFQKTELLILVEGVVELQVHLMLQVVMAVRALLFSDILTNINWVQPLAHQQ